ncbi:MAG TPA: TA system VapC family ribonuclease toxin [Thermoanaerobaculia bacterium]|nr:TA system VapC family ribonuclease toxin [Thermoanaerobaculia bacterium]
MAGRVEPAGVDLPDVNVWLALSVPDHVHHARARRYWFEEAAATVAFCRATALSFLRLSTLPAAMAGEPLTVAQAWQTYRQFLELPDVILAVEPRDCDAYFGAWANRSDARPKLWTDAYLAAFARAAAFRLVSFDKDFTSFEHPDLLRLEV